jgi:hypothetical protein
MAKNEYPGLCSICLHREACIFTKGKQSSVLFCEEFQIESVPAGAFYRPEAAGDANTGKPLALEEGLCCDCKSRRECGLMSKTEGGIWYCEEYR